MKPRWLVLASLCICALLLCAASAYAFVPQTVGMYDTVFNPATDPQTCRGCHTLVADVHHTTTTECSSCHQLVYDPVTGNYMMSMPGCLDAGCHNTSAVHESSAAAYAQDCTAGGCHDPALLDTPFDGHYIPATPPGDRTPTFGSCMTCHVPEQGTMIMSTADTHHSLAYPNNVVNCEMCHDLQGFASTRNCMRCHGSDKLHAIPGHSESQAACEGCHGPGALPPLELPVIAGIEPIPDGSGLVMTGSDFGAQMFDSLDGVYVDGVRATIISWSDTEIRFAAEYGVHTITVVTSAGSSAAIEYAFVPLGVTHQTTNTTCVGAGCHVVDLGEVHQFLGCVCHAAPNYAVDNGITDCEACHASAHPLPDHNAPASACVQCHSFDLVQIHYSQCFVCHESPVPTVVAAVAAGIKDCSACHGMHGGGEVSAVSPSAALSGESVQITGSGLIMTTGVTFESADGVPTGTTFAIQSDSTITCVVPDVPAGTYTIVVGGPYALIGSLSFTVVQPEPHPVASNCGACHASGSLEVNSEIIAMTETTATIQLDVWTDLPVSGWAVTSDADTTMVAKSVGPDGIVAVDLPLGKTYRAWFVAGASSGFVDFDTIPESGHVSTSEPCGACHTTNLVGMHLECNTCHGSLAYPVRAAIASHDTLCEACHTPAAPQVAALNPSAGVSGTWIQISGTGFYPVSQVEFTRNGVTKASLTPVIASDYRLGVAVPPIPPGIYTVTLISGHGNSAPMTFTVTCALDSITPTRGVAGTLVTLTGRNFSYTPAGSGGSVLFGDVVAPIESWNMSEIVVRVPENLSAGDNPVVVRTEAGDTAAQTFTFVPAPVIDARTPLQGLPGTVVTVTGSGFSWNAQEITFVRDDGMQAAAPFEVLSDSALCVTVPTLPPGAWSIAITTEGGVARTGFVVTSVLQKSSSVLVRPGDLIKLTGLNLGATQGFSAIAFNGIPATAYVSWSNTEVRCRVPAGLVRGTCAITLTAPGYVSAPIIIKAR